MGLFLTTIFPLLNRRALHRPKTAIHTAVPFIRFQYRFAIAAFIKVLAGIGGHGLHFCEAAAWAGDF